MAGLAAAANMQGASSKLMMGLLLLLVTFAAGTFLAISGRLPPISASPLGIGILLMTDVAILLLISAVMARHIYTFWKRIRSGMRNSRLQRNILLSFCLVTALPTLIVTVFSALFFNLGVQAWFNEKVNTAVVESLAVAESYMKEHRENIRQDVLAMAADISHFYETTYVSQVEFNRFVSAQASRRKLTEVVIFQRNRIIAQGRLSFSLAFESLPQSAIARASEGDVIILENEEGDDRVRALTRVESIDDGYLLVGRLMDEQVIRHMENTQGAVSAYLNLKNQLKTLQWTFSLVFLMLSVALVLAALWYGLVFASRLTSPISRLAVAAERVRAGDYSGKLDVGNGDDEISILSRTFNRMVDQLDSQRKELIFANRELDGRRRFTEAVLGGVSAGVIALNAERVITLINRSAASALGKAMEDLQERPVGEVIPGIQELLVQADVTRGEVVQSTITIQIGTTTRTLHARVVAEFAGEEKQGYIVTFDDITALVAAQRNAAWSDVARRVAHEIKNPLTPISLSTERLKRKYAKYIEEGEEENFHRYLDTISRHVGDIGRMVEEFVSFARMPGAVMKEVNLVQTLRRVVFSEQVAHNTISYEFKHEMDELKFKGDDRQISQVMTNLLKNAAEAIEGEQADQLKDNAPKQGSITVTLAAPDKEHVTVTVEDTGPGFPPDKIHSMLEPYVTTRSKGTGLGLAIVKKVVEEHGGTLSLSNRKGGGAIVTLSFLQHCDIKAST